MIAFESDHLLSYREVARILGVKTSLLRSWVSRNAIPFRKLGPGQRGTVRFDPEELNAWLRERSGMLQVVS
ncbi:MAG: helix-turn-helix domain-containing protein [Acidobacteriota bacterium]|jgi:excisionase family DNA binding protein|nr:helix-turn-helix domain-containing protein [Acidobacteriota bacterium]